MAHTRRGRARPRIQAQIPPGCDPSSILLVFPVPPEWAGIRLDLFIQRRIPRLSRTRAQAIVKACAYRADGRRRRPSERVQEGEVVLLVRQRFEEPKDVPLHFDVLLEDEAILAVDKPAGLPMHPTATYHRHTLSYLLRTRYGEPVPQIAHRLDRETSGVVLCAKTLAHERILKLAFERHAVEKGYLAITEGELANDRGRIELPMGPVDEGLHVLMEVKPPGEGATAITDYEVLARGRGHSLVALSPASGRQHQLRVHLAAIGNPIVGDKLYGAEREAPFLDYIDQGMTPALVARLKHPRQALHAHRVGFMHPERGTRVSVTAPFPPDLAALWARLTGMPLPTEAGSNATMACAIPSKLRASGGPPALARAGGPWVGLG